MKENYLDTLLFDDSKVFQTQKLIDSNSDCNCDCDCGNNECYDCNCDCDDCGIDDCGNDL